MFQVAKKTNASKTFEETIAEAKKKNTQIAQMAPKIEDPELVKMIREINETVHKIIATIEKTPAKYKKANNFFNYYLPVTITILSRYDEIENQSLTTQEGKEFMQSTKNMVEKINEAFKKQLSNLYQSDMIDTDAEMKVFESMLQADGYNQENDFKVEEGEDE